MNSYTLVNPVILGTFQQTYNASTPLEAAKNFWLELTEKKYLLNSMPKFYFSMQEGGSSSLHHFKVKETLTGKKNKTAVWKMKKINVDVDSNELNNILKKSEEVRNNNLIGGRHRHRHSKSSNSDDDSSSSSSDSSSSSSSDSSSSSSEENRLLHRLRLSKNRSSIKYWWYSPSMYKIDYSFPPSFTYSHSPRVVYYIAT